MIQAVIFDMDGLMIDSEPIQSKSYESVLIEYDKKPEYHKNGLIQVLGVHAGDNWKILKEKHQLSESVEVLLEKKTLAYMELIKNNLTPMPGLIKLLEYLKKESIAMAVASSAPLNQIKHILHELGISHYFQAVVSGENVKKGKPYPDIFLETANQLKIKPEYCLVLEDAESGVAAGKAARMTVVAVQNKFTHNQDHSKADKVVNSLQSVTMKLINTL
jgi:HAD superfamily hydrolase (TIGR01509 family)